MQVFAGLLTRVQSDQTKIPGSATEGSLNTEALGCAFFVAPFASFFSGNALARGTRASTLCFVVSALPRERLALPDRVQ